MDGRPTNGKIPTPAEAEADRSRFVIEAVPGLVWSSRPDGSLEFLNQGWTDYTGHPREQITDWGWISAHFIHPDDVVGLFDSWKAKMRAKEETHLEARLRRADGEYRWFLWQAKPQVDDGHVTRWYGTGIDIHGRKRAEELLDAENQILELIGKGEPLATILDALCRLVDRFSSCSFASILLLDPNQDRFWLGAAPSLPESYSSAMNGVPVEPVIGSCGAAVLTRAQVISSDIATDPHWTGLRDMALSHGLRACWSTPIFASTGDILGTFAIHSNEPRTPTADDHTLIDQITHLASIAIERTRSQEALRRTELEFRAIVDAIPHPISVINTAGEVLYANKPVLEIFGLTAEEVAAGDLIERMHPGDRAASRDWINTAITRPESFETDYRLMMRDGQYRWFLNHFRPVLDEQGRILRWYVSGIDIEERKQQEERHRKENIALREEIDAKYMFEEIVGRSPSLRTVLGRVDQVAPTDSTVLILGETGTGKELMARAIHKRSKRAAGAFVTVNCAALPPTLITSELFGHEKGAFTGAMQRRLGRFELAEGGTLFLDEIGELPLETQVMLLRVLQEREFERVGGNEPIKVDVRIIAATNRDLQGLIVEGKFRSDLFYRLNVFPIEMPPLKERTEDIPLLVEYFVGHYASKAGKRFRRIAKSTLERLVAYRWPGNIRELQNVIERSVIVCTADEFTIDASWIVQRPAAPEMAGRKLSKKLEDQEKQLIEQALADTKGRVAGPRGAAAKLGMPPSTLDSKIRTLGINKHRFQTN